MSRLAALLALVACSVIAGEAAPLTGRHVEDAVASYLVIDGRRAVVMDAEGCLTVAFRLAEVAGQSRGLALGVESGAVFQRSATTVTVTVPGQPALVFTLCSDAPAAIGLLPYSLPAAAGDPERRKAVAVEIRKRFDTEQRLRGEFMRLTAGRMDQETMAKPAVLKAMQAMNAADDDNRTWLMRTLQNDGWIGRKTHGDKAHEALVFIALHNIQHLRLAATVLEGLQTELKRGEISEMAVANIADRLALVLGDPLAYGIQATVDASGRTIIPVIADGDALDANRKRIGQPPMAQAAASMGAKVLRIGDDGRLVGEGAANARGLDLLDTARALREPAWGLAEAGKADPVLGGAIAAAKGGDAKPMAAWTRAAGAGHRNLVARILMAQGGQAGGDAESAVTAVRPLFDGLLDGLPADDELRIVAGNVLAYSLVARSAAPTAEELARAVAIADGLERALKRPEVAGNPLGHAIADTVACIRYRQGERKAAAAMWQRAISLAGKDVPELYHRRQAAAEGADAAAPLPR